MMVSQDGSGPVEGTEMGRPELASYRYKVSYGQTPDVKMGQELYHPGLELCCKTAGNTQTSNITVLSPSPPLSLLQSSWCLIWGGGQQLSSQTADDTRGEISSSAIRSHQCDNLTMELFPFLWQQPGPPTITLCCGDCRGNYSEISPLPLSASLITSARIFRSMGSSGAPLHNKVSLAAK